jgi:hypothetical protein
MFLRRLCEVSKQTSFVVLLALIKSRVSRRDMDAQRNEVSWVHCSTCSRSPWNTAFSGSDVETDGVKPVSLGNPVCDFADLLLANGEPYSNSGHSSALSSFGRFGQL